MSLKTIYCSKASQIQLPLFDTLQVGRNQGWALTVLSVKCGVWVYCRRKKFSIWVKFWIRNYMAVFQQKFITLGARLVGGNFVDICAWDVCSARYVLVAAESSYALIPRTQTETLIDLVVCWSFRELNDF